MAHSAITDWFLTFTYLTAGLLYALNYDKRPTPVDPETERQRHEHLG
jgi:hypothetical protein